MKETKIFFLNGEEFSTEENPVLTIEQPGSYDVKLEVIGSAACNTVDVVFGVKVLPVKVIF